MSRIVELANAAYANGVVARLLHTTPACLKEVLLGCRLVLDLGCGARSPVSSVCEAWTVGVELFEPSLRSARDSGTHDAFVLGDLREVEFGARSVDAVVMIEVLEHLSKADGLALLDRAETWARRRVVITTPNGYVPQVPLEGNPYQQHLSGWKVEELVARGYHPRGLAGLKWLRRENDHDVVQSNTDAMLASIRWRPRPLWLAVSALSQLVTYRVPKWSFGVLYVRENDAVNANEI